MSDLLPGRCVRADGKPSAGPATDEPVIETGWRARILRRPLLSIVCVVVVVVFAAGLGYLLTRASQTGETSDATSQESRGPSANGEPSESNGGQGIAVEVPKQADTTTESADPGKQGKAKDSTKGNEWTISKPGVWLHKGGDFRLQFLRVNSEPGAPASPTAGAACENSLFLEFAITKVEDSVSPPAALSVAAIDDQANEYRGVLPVAITDPPRQNRGTTRPGAPGPRCEVTPFLPKGFAYVNKVAISAPGKAVLKQIKVGDTAPISIPSGPPTVPRLLTDFGPLTWQKQLSLQVGKWLSFRCDSISRVATGVGWSILIEATNEEANALDAVVRVGVQYGDGAVVWSEEQKCPVPGPSKRPFPVGFPLPQGTMLGPPQPVAMLLLFHNVAENVRDLKIIPLSAKDVPPCVGQGAKGLDAKVFENAYHASVPDRSEKDMGDPVTPVCWLAGGNKPRDEKDVLVQHFPSVSRFGRSAIVFDKQRGAKDAYVIHGEEWEKYLNPASELRRSLGSFVRLYKSPETGYDQFDFEGGYVASADGKTLKVCPYEEGKIAFASDTEGNSEIYVTDPRGMTQVRLTENSADDWGPAWSPDGKKIAFVSDRGGKPGVYVMDADGSNVLQLTKVGNGDDDPCWYPDGSKIAFVRQTPAKKKPGDPNGDYVLHTMNANGSGQTPMLSKVKGVPAGLDIRCPDVFLKSTPARIAFAAGDWGGRGGYGIYIYELGKQLLPPATFGLAICDSPSFSPDGLKLAFRADTGTFRDMQQPQRRVFRGSLHWIDLKKKGGSKVCNNVWCWGEIDWSADGQAIAFSADCASKATGKTNICIVRVNDGVARFITYGKGNSYDPSWWAPAAKPQSPPEDAAKE